MRIYIPLIVISSIFWGCKSQPTVNIVVPFKAELIPKYFDISGDNIEIKPSAPEFKAEFEVKKGFDLSQLQIEGLEISHLFYTIGEWMDSGFKFFGFCGNDKIISEKVNNLLRLEKNRMANLDNTFWKCESKLYPGTKDLVQYTQPLGTYDLLRRIALILGFPVPNPQGLSPFEPEMRANANHTYPSVFYNISFTGYLIHFYKENKRDDLYWNSLSATFTMNSSDIHLHNLDSNMNIVIYCEDKRVTMRTPKRKFRLNKKYESESIVLGFELKKMLHGSGLHQDMKGSFHLKLRNREDGYRDCGIRIYELLLESFYVDIEELNEFDDMNKDLYSIIEVEKPENQSPQHIFSYYIPLREGKRVGGKFYNINRSIENSGSDRNIVDIDVEWEYKLHLRYQNISNISYTNISTVNPYAFLICTERGNRKVEQKRSEGNIPEYLALLHTGPMWWYNRENEMRILLGYEGSRDMLTTQVPNGMEQHRSFVLLGTFLITFLAVLWVLYISYHKSKYFLLGIQGQHIKHT